MLVIHTNKMARLRKAQPASATRTSWKNLREESRKIDRGESNYLAIVSVMMLREGWDVQNVTCIVGLRPYKAKSQILARAELWAVA